MAGLASSTVQRASKPPQSQASSDEMAETLRAWDDEEDEVVEFMQSKKDGSRQNTNGSSSLPSVGASRPVARYSPSTVRCAKTLCLYTSFFGLVSLHGNFNLRISLCVIFPVSISRSFISNHIVF